MFGVPSPGKFKFRLPRLHRPKPGTTPGIEVEQLKQMPSGPQRVVLTCIDYSPEKAQVVDVQDVDDFLSHHRPEWAQVRWINVEGLTDMRIIHALAKKYDLHPLAIEDLVHPGTRPKVEAYPGEEGHPSRLFILARMIYLVQERLHCEQVCFFLGKSTLLTFQETHEENDLWECVRTRIQRDGSRVRTNDVSFLLYALIDAVVDQCFPVMECYSDRLEKIEGEVLNRPDPEVIARIHEVKHELLLLRKEFWPMREMLYALQRIDHANFSATASLFLRDVYDHAIQVMDLMETYREVAIGLTETYMNAMSQRMNEVMKVLTVFSTIFMPLSFLAGVFGMNFKHMPELDANWAYPGGFFILCLGVTVGLIFWFRRNKWL